LISILVPTNRVGGLDILFSSLAKQTEKNFELILVDNIKRYRPTLFGMSKRVPLTHVEPRDNPFPNVSYCRSVNSGIAHARGETVLLLCDYSWCDPRMVELHAECQKKKPGPYHFDYNYTALPKLKDGFPGYHQGGMDGSDARYVDTLNATTERYCADLEAGKLDSFMWSIFDETPTADSVAELEVTHRHRPCATRQADDWNFCSFKNESIPTELLLELNGLNEDMDESHVYQDLEWSYRMRRRGVPWNNGPPELGMVTVVNPRPVLNIKRMSRPISHNKWICDSQLGTLANPEFSLREWRERTIGA